MTFFRQNPTSRFSFPLAALFLVVGVFAVTTSGCKKSPKGNNPSDPLAERKAAAQNLGTGVFFKHIPAETPYAFASFEPLPGGLFDSMASSFTSMMKILEPEINEAISEKKGREGKIARALFKELKGKLNKEGLASLGISTTPEYAFYGLGPMPVLRVQLADGDKLRSVIERVSKESGESIPWKTLGGIRYISGNKSDVSFVFSILDDSIVAAVVSTEVFDKMLPLVLGTEQPKVSMATGDNLLKKVAGKHGFGPHGVGYVDFEKIYRGATGKETGEMLAFWQGLTKGDWAKPDPGCVPHIERLTSVLTPRLVFGYGDLNAQRIDFSIFVEMAPALIAGLNSLKFPTPGLTDDALESSKIAIGGGINLKNAQRLAGIVAPELDKVGSDCKEKDFSSMAGDLRDFSTQDLPKEFGDKLGFVAALLEGRFDMSASEPAGLVGFAVIHLTDTPEELVKLANQKAGGQVVVNVPPDGKFHKQDLPVPAKIVDGIFLALKDNLILLAAGEKAKAVALEASQVVPENPPFFALSYDMSFFADIFEEIAAKEADDERQKGIISLAVSMYRQWGNVSMKFHATGNGLGFTFVTNRRN